MLLAGGIATLAASIQSSNQYGQGRALATQHGRVALERMERNLRGATASPEFPGFAAFAETVGGFKCPDTLVVWRPASGLPANPAGRPLFSELVLFRPDPNQPNVLLEITVPGENRVTPPLSDVASWNSELGTLKYLSSYQAVTLTDLVRTASTTSEIAEMNGRRGCLRFEIEQSPSEAELADYRSGKTAWKDLSWVQGIYGSKAGLRQSACRIELQLVPGKQAQTSDPGGVTALPFFGSGALYFQVNP
jgi:hypothetical protein